MDGDYSAVVSKWGVITLGSFVDQFVTRIFSRYQVGLLRSIGN